MRKWIGLGSIAGLLAVLTGCPEFGRMTYRFDLATGQGVLRVEDIGTDDPGKAEQDFAQIVNEYVLGSKVQDDHPSWRVGTRELVARGGQLDAVVTFEFSRPEDVNLYKHDKKSPYFWCAEGDEEVVSTSGTVIPQYPNCVAFDRKAKQLEVTVSDGGGGQRQSLLPQFEAWDGEAIEMTAPGLSDLGGIFGEAFRGAFDQGLGGEGGPSDVEEALGALGGLLPKVEATADWKALGLPLANSQVVFQTDGTYQASHGGADGAKVLRKYSEALGALGWAVAEDQGELVVWEREGARMTGTATRAGASVIVSLSR
jgi:hypothetical protein